jgi:hypothetical protein
MQAVKNGSKAPESRQSFNLGHPANQAEQSDAKPLHRCRHFLRLQIHNREAPAFQYEPHRSETQISTKQKAIK